MLSIRLCNYGIDNRYRDIFHEHDRLHVPIEWEFFVPIQFSNNQNRCNNVRPMLVRQFRQGTDDEQRLVNENLVCNDIDSHHDESPIHELVHTIEYGIVFRFQFIYVVNVC